MNKYNNPRLLNTVVSGTGMKHPMLPHVVVGDTANGFIRGDLMDANAIVELVNNIIGGAPDTLDTLKEAADRIAALEHDTRDWLTQDDTLASRVDGLFKSLQILLHSEKYSDHEDSGLMFKFFTERFDKYAENRYEEYFIPQATSTRNGVMSSAQAQALEEASAASAEIPQIKQTIEDNELTVAAALSDLNSRVAELEPDKRDRVYILCESRDMSSNVYPSSCRPYIFGYVENGHRLVVYATTHIANGTREGALQSDIYAANANLLGFIVPVNQSSNQLLAGYTIFKNNAPGAIDQAFVRYINTWLLTEIDQIDYELIDTDPNIVGTRIKHLEDYILVPQTNNMMETFGRVRVTYNITDTQNPTHLFTAPSDTLSWKIKVDGEFIDIANLLPSGDYLFDTTGDHIVEYWFYNSNIPESVFTDNKSITSIVFLDYVVNLLGNALAGCDNIQYVKFNLNWTPFTATQQLAFSVQNPEYPLTYKNGTYPIYVPDDCMSTTWTSTTGYMAYIHDSRLKPISEYYETH